jgi:hypothetical protein
MSEWISVKERLPKPEMVRHRLVRFWVTDGKEVWDTIESPFSKAVTHWQLIAQPKLPQPKKRSPKRDSD